MNRWVGWGHWALAVLFLFGAGVSLVLGLTKGPWWWAAVGMAQLLLCALEVSSAVQAGRRERVGVPAAD